MDPVKILANNFGVDKVLVSGKIFNCDRVDLDIDSSKFSSYIMSSLTSSIFYCNFFAFILVVYLCDF